MVGYGQNCCPFMYYCVHVHMGVHACKCVCLLESVNVNHLWYGMWKAEPNILLHHHMPISTEQLLGKISLAGCEPAIFCSMVRRSGQLYSFLAAKKTTQLSERFSLTGPEIEMPLTSFGRVLQVHATDHTTRF